MREVQEQDSLKDIQQQNPAAVQLGNNVTQASALNRGNNTNTVSPSSADGSVNANMPTPQTTQLSQTGMSTSSSQVSAPTSGQNPNSYVARAKAAIGESSNKDDKQKALLRKILIIGGIVVGIIIVALLAWFLITKLINKDSGTAPGPFDPAEEQERNEENKTIFQDVYDEATSDNSGESAEDVFQQAINAAGNNTGEANAVRVSQMRYLLEQGDYDKIIEVGEQTGGGNGGGSNGNGGNGSSGGGTGGSTGDIDACEDVNLGLDLRISCHNILGLAYSYRDEVELSDYHMAKMKELMNEKMRMEYPR